MAGKSSSASGRIGVGRVLLLLLGLVIVVGVTIWMRPTLLAPLFARVPAVLKATMDERAAALKERAEPLDRIATTLFPGGSFDRITRFEKSVLSVSFVGTPAPARLSEERLDELGAELYRLFNELGEARDTMSMRGGADAEGVGFHRRQHYGVTYERSGWFGECTLIVGENPDVVSITILEYRT